MPETATTWDAIEIWEIKQEAEREGISVKAEECTSPKSCAHCGGEILPGEWELPINGKHIHDHHAEDLGVEVR